MYTGHFLVGTLLLCFLTTDAPAYSAPDRHAWLQHASLVANYMLLVLLLQQLEMDRIFFADASNEQCYQSTMFGNVGWEQLIVRCFDDIE